MDIGKYIGRFLLKNKYCSLPGLGVFDLKKIAAKQNETNDSLSAPTYKISFTPVGSIDDTFASFIASAENVSISNASNHIRDYCKSVKDELAKTGKFDIDFLGRFTMSNNKLVFNQADDLDLGVESVPLTPLADKSKTVEATQVKTDYSYPPARPHKEFPVLKVLLGFVAIGLLATGAYLAYQFMNEKQAVIPEADVMPVMDSTSVDTIDQTADSIFTMQSDSAAGMLDSTANPADSGMNTNSPASVPAPAGNLYSVAILSYDNEASANAKAGKLQRYGNNASVVNSNGRYIVIIQATNPLNDTTKLVDSLRRFFNPKGPVYILK